jgi:proteasome lid subunit RPN8/RPN11
VSLIVPRDLLHMMLEQCRRGYPEERCGALLGYGAEADVRVIVRVLPLANQHDSERRTRYLIGPDEFRAAEAGARADGLDIIGFYHSHPDHPAIPSAFDREHAWPWYSYVIVPVHDRRPGVPRAWRLAEDRSRFQELEIVQHAVQPTPAKEAS